jgi:hypothetical protein
MANQDTNSDRNQNLYVQNRIPWAVRFGHDKPSTSRNDSGFSASGEARREVSGRFC